MLYIYRKTVYPENPFKRSIHFAQTYLKITRIEFFLTKSAVFWGKAIEKTTDRDDLQFGAYRNIKLSQFNN